MRLAVVDGLTTITLMSLMLVVGLFPQLICEWLLFTSLFIYVFMSYKLFITKTASGHHKYGEKSSYICIDTGKRLGFNEDSWNPSGEEHTFGLLAFGHMSFTNSFRLPGSTKYVGIKLAVPHFFSVGIELGLVDGYRPYYNDGQMTSGIPVGRKYLFFMAPTIRWRPAHKRHTFVAIRQFGSATVTTEGSVET